MHLVNFESMNSPLTLLLEGSVGYTSVNGSPMWSVGNLRQVISQYVLLRPQLKSPHGVISTTSAITTSVVIISGMRVDGGRVAKWSLLQLKQG